jgi:hypothetical protein
MTRIQDISINVKATINQVGKAIVVWRSIWDRRIAPEDFVIGVQRVE